MSALRKSLCPGLELHSFFIVQPSHTYFTSRYLPQDCMNLIWGSPSEGASIPLHSCPTAWFLVSGPGSRQLLGPELQME